MQISDVPAIPERVEVSDFVNIFIQRVTRSCNFTVKDIGYCLHYTL